MFTKLHIDVLGRWESGVSIPQYPPLGIAIAILLALTGWEDLVLQVEGYHDGPTPHPM